MTRGRRTQGLSLAETVVACALLSLLLGATAAMQKGTRRAATLSESTVARGQLTELASELLRYHLGLAGYRGAVAEQQDGEPALLLARGAGQGGSDVLTVRYVEERWYREPLERVLHFDVKRDGRGLWNLYQREHGATRQPAVQEVNGLAVLAFLTPDGPPLPADTPLPLEAAGLELLLDFTWGQSRTVTIPFGTAQLVGAGP